MEEAARVAAAESAAKIETLEAAAAAKEIEMAKLERRLNEAEKAARATMKANATGMPWPAVNASAATIQAHARGNHARLVELPHAMRVKSFVLQAVLRISGDTSRESSRGASRRRYRSSSEGRSSRRITARARGSGGRSRSSCERV